MTFFCSLTFFAHFFQKYFNTYQYLSYLASSVPQSTFSLPAWWKNIRASWRWAKIKINGGMEVKYWGNGSPHPPGICSPVYNVYCIMYYVYCLVSNHLTYKQLMHLLTTLHKLKWKHFGAYVCVGRVTKILAKCTLSTITVT